VISPIDGSKQLTFAEVLDGFLKELGHLRSLGDVGLDSNRLAAGLLNLGDGGQGRLGGGGIVDADGGTTLSKGFGKASTETSTGSSDESDLAVKTNLFFAAHFEREVLDEHEAK
jgi:hypothetical protein